MFVFALCLLGTALALPAIPPAPVLPVGRDLILNAPEVYPYAMPYGIVPEFAPFAPLEFKIEEIPKEEKELKVLTEEEEDVELEKREEELKTEEEPITEEPRKPVELKPENVFVKLDLFKPPAFIGNLLPYIPFQLPAPITNWITGGKLSTRFVYPRVPGYVIVDRPTV